MVIDGSSGSGMRPVIEGAAKVTNFDYSPDGFKMNQTCKVCGEPAAGFHFGAFTCEGCKSFFGRSYNNVNSINDCKNNNKCVINKKNRTSCKACRLRKCIFVGMSKSGSRYGRRSNWFKIHCLLQEQQQKQMQSGSSQEHNGDEPPHPHQIQMPPNQSMGMRLLNNGHFAPPMMGIPRTREDLMMLGLGEESFRPSASPSVSSPESHNSDSSIECGEARRLPPVIPGFFPPNFYPHTPLLFPTSYPAFYSNLLHQPYPQPLNNNDQSKNHKKHDQETPVPTQVKREYLDAVLQLQRNTPPEEEEEEVEDENEEVDVKTPVPTISPVQDAPIDLSMKTMSEKESSVSDSEDSSGSGRMSAADEEEENAHGRNALDLTNKV